VIVVEGHPHNYCKHGFVGSKSVGVSNSEGRYPLSLLVFELEKECLQNHVWKYYPSDVYNLDKQKAEEFDKEFPPKKSFYRYTQEEFRIASNALVE
jgi:putative acetyltransferase